MVECGICLEEYQESELELHREMCVVRLMFRCSLCNEDYVSKEGLWNHLDLHEIVDESKEVHYQEIKAKYKLHQCVLCNDQRAYSESSYWKHIHDVHDGFFLRCSDCGENFRSEELKNDHASSLCQARDETVVSDFNALEEEPVPFEAATMTSDAEHLKPSQGEQSGNVNEGLTNGVLFVNLNTANDSIIDKELELATINSAESNKLLSKFACDICGTIFSSKGALLHHKRAKYSCIERRQRKCPHCRRKFQINEYQAHFSLCETKKFACELCPSRFKVSRYLGMHMQYVHRQKRALKSQMKAQNQVNDITEKTINLAEKTTKRSGPEILASSSESFSSSNVVEDKDITTAKTDIADNSVQLHVENLSNTSSSASSSTRCVYCDEECASARNLSYHILQSHQPTKCKICDITFEGASRARFHKIVEHMKPKYECSKCLKTFHCINFYNRHSKVCVPVQSNFSSYESSGDFILNDRRVKKVATENPSSEASRTKCSHCGIEESSNVTLARHILMHHNPVACDFCGTTLSSLSQAQHHMKMMHKESKHKCPHCSMQFFARVRLQRHVSKCENEKVSCEFCGKMFENASAANKHKKRTCREYRRSKEQMQQNAKPSLRLRKPLVKCRLSKIECYYCNDEFSSPGYLNHHLKTHHQLTKCNICGITVLGISELKHHKMQHQNKLKYECKTCERKFHLKSRYTAHCASCERKMFKKLNSANRLNERYPADESNLKNLQIDQDQKLAETDDLTMEITVEETTSAARDDDQRQSTVNPSSKIDVSSGPSLTQDRNSSDSQGINKESRMPFVATLNGSSEGQIDSDESSQSMDENQSNRQYLCNICETDFYSSHRLRYHMKTKHTEGKFQCAHCSRKFHFIRLLECHEPLCADLKYPCELCGQRFNLPNRLENHKKQGHQTNPTIVPQGGHMELKLDIKVEETKLQEQEYQLSNEGSERSITSALIMHPHFAKSKDDEAEDAADHENGIKVKEEYLEDEEKIQTEHQNTTESSEFHGIPIDRNESLVSQEVGDRSVKGNSTNQCSICGLTLKKKTNVRYHMIRYHTEPRHKCARCQKTFHFTGPLKQHFKNCSGLRCNICDVKFATQQQIDNHNMHKHPNDSKSKDVEAEDADQ